MSRKRSFFTTFFVFVACIALAAFLLWQRFNTFANAPINGLANEGYVMVERGDAFATVLRKLRAAGITAGSDVEWQALARQSGAAGKVQVGEYGLKPGMTPMQLLTNMRDGKVVNYRVTLVDGWTFKQFRAALKRANNLPQKTAGMTDAEVMKALGHEGQHPEGRFLPETYQYHRNDSDLDILKRAYEGMTNALADVWRSRAADLPYKSPYELLTMASIVEKETGAPEERAQVAGVFVRRLKLGMRLETDPTIIYGLGDAYKGDITWAHLRTDGPYNTRTRTGLPPTPISMPGLASLKASAQPAPGDAIFFVAVGDGSGRSRFAATYPEHQRNVAAYLANRRADARNADEPMRGTVTISEDGAAESVTDAPVAPETEAPAQSTPRP